MCDDFMGDWDGMDDYFDNTEFNETEPVNELNEDDNQFIHDDLIQPNEDSGDILDKADVMIFGSMIVGNAYEEAIDRATRKRMQKKDRGD